jgi:hypothetical protein
MALRWSNGAVESAVIDDESSRLQFWREKLEICTILKN